MALEDEAGDDHRDDNDEEKEGGGRRGEESLRLLEREEASERGIQSSDRMIGGVFGRGGGKRDPLPSIQTALELLPWVICKCIYFDFCPFLSVVSPYSFGLIKLRVWSSRNRYNGVKSGIRAVENDNSKEKGKIRVQRRIFSPDGYTLD